MMTPIDYEPVRLNEALTRADILDVSQFQEEPRLGNGMPILGVIKRTNQNERDAFIRAQMLATGSNAVNVIRSDTSNRYYHGKLTIHTIEDDHIGPDNALRTKIMLQPTAAALQPLTGKIMVGAANEVFALDQDLNEEYLIRHPWFSRLHTIAFDSTGQRAILTSASMDMLHVIDVQDRRVVQEFSLWDIFKCYNQQGQVLKRQGISQQFPLEPQDEVLEVAPDGLGLHHSKVALHINSAIWGDDGQILLTSFKTGSLYQLDAFRGLISTKIQGLGHPHNILRTKQGYMVTDTLGERVLLLDNDLIPQQALNFGRMGNKKTGLEVEKWLQSAVAMPGGLIAAVDSPRSSVFVVDPVNRLRRRIKFDDNWAMQTVLPLEG